MVAYAKLIAQEETARSLGSAPNGFKGFIKEVTNIHSAHGLPSGELESRLLELGFVEGARVEILHQGTFNKDPIAVRVNNSTIALRRSEAMAILVA